MQLVRINNSHKHREQTAQREQTQQVELRAGFMKNTISYSPIFSFTVFKNPPALKVGWYYQFYIFFAPNNASSETWFYDGDGNMPTENSTLYVNFYLSILFNTL